MIAYPIVPIMAIIGAIYVIYGMLVYQTFNGIASIVLTLLGLPLYYYYHSKNKNRELSLGEMKKYRIKTQYLIAIATVFVVLLLAICGYIINK